MVREAASEGLREVRCVPEGASAQEVFEGAPALEGDGAPRAAGLKPLALFVYGTLRPGLGEPSLARWLAGARRLGSAHVLGRLVDLGAYPGAVLDASAETQILGDLLEIGSEALLRTLDAYEGFDPARPAESLYLRVGTLAHRPDGTARRCEIYVYARDVTGLPLVPGGDWAARRG